MARWPGIPAVGYLWCHPTCYPAQGAVGGCCCSELMQQSFRAQRLSPALLCSLPGGIKEQYTDYMLSTGHLDRQGKAYVYITLHVI